MQVAKRSNLLRTVPKELVLLTMVIISIVITPSSVIAQAKNTTNVAAATDGRSKPSNESSSYSVEEQLLELKKQLAEQQQEISELRLLVQEQRKLAAGQSEVARRSSASSSESQVSGASNPKPLLYAPLATATVDRQGPEVQPLSFRIGSAYITPVGFMDFTAVVRSTNSGTGIGTNFGSIPFNDTTAGKLSEVRLSAQNSRIGFRVDANVKGANVIGYFESDFLGSVPANIAVTSNSAPNRLRLYWVDVRRGKIELMGGQSWSMLTPNRKGCRRSQATSSTPRISTLTIRQVWCGAETRSSALSIIRTIAWRSASHLRIPNSTSVVRLAAAW